MILLLLHLLLVVVPFLLLLLLLLLVPGGARNTRKETADCAKPSAKLLSIDTVMVVLWRLFQGLLVAFVPTGGGAGEWMVDVVVIADIYIDRNRCCCRCGGCFCQDGIGLLTSNVKSGT